jgi:hypothetical protein
MGGRGLAGTAGAAAAVVVVGKYNLLFGCCCVVVGTAAGPEAGAKGLGSGPNLAVTLPGT